MLRGWKFTADYVKKRRLCTISGFAALELKDSLVYTLKLVNKIDQEIQVHANSLDDNEFWSAVYLSKKPCITIVFGVTYVQNTELHLHWVEHLLNVVVGEKKGIVLFVARFLTVIPQTFLRLSSSLIWNLSYYVNVPFVSLHYPMVSKFMNEQRSALLYQGPILCDEIDNVCCTLDLCGLKGSSGAFPQVQMLEESPLFLSVVKTLQERLHRKVKSSQVIQRFVKQWLYRPGTAFSYQIIQRLYSSKQ
jgi:branched-subunit amino acid transport protein